VRDDVAEGACAGGGWVVGGVGGRSWWTAVFMYQSHLVAMIVDGRTAAAEHDRVTSPAGNVQLLEAPFPSAVVLLTADHLFIIARNKQMQTILSSAKQDGS